MPFAELPGVRLWFTDSGGDGVPVVLLHAASGTSESWFQQVPEFSAAGYRCICYDRRGWGRSESTDGPPPASPADDLRTLLDHLGVDRAHLAGTAAGAAVAVDYTLSWPERVRSLVIADGNAGLRDDPEYLELRKRARPPEFEALPTYLREVGPSYRATNPEGVARWIEIEEHSGHATATRQKDRNHVTLETFKTLKTPTLVMVGGADMSTPPALVRMVAERIPGCRFETVPDAGHAAFWEQPAIWNRHVLDFIREH